MIDHEIIEQNSTQLSNQMTQFEELLISMGLPSENIIASIEERENMVLRYNYGHEMLNRL